jgi:hypothetical protein
MSKFYGRAKRLYASYAPSPLTRAGGCVFADDPARGADKAIILWDRSHDHLVLQVNATACTAQDPDGFDLLAQPHAATILVGERGGQEVLLGGHRASIRLSVRRGSLLDGPVRLAFEIGGRNLARPLQALAQWDMLMRTGRIALGRTALLTARQTRWPLIVRTLECLADAKSYRAMAMAMALFGEDEVKANWSHESDYLKMRIRRLVAQARGLLAFGYLDLL